MNLETAPSWPSIILAVILFGDVILSIRPAHFIEKCLTGVKFPRQWWWALIYIKCVDQMRRYFRSNNRTVVARDRNCGTSRHRRIFLCRSLCSLKSSIHRHRILD